MSTRPLNVDSFEMLKKNITVEVHTVIEQQCASLLATKQQRNHKSMTKFLRKKTLSLVQGCCVLWSAIPA